MDYWQKLETNPYEDLFWNIPEIKQGNINLIGGNSQSFNTEIKISEFLLKNYPIKDLKTLLPDQLKTKLPPLNNLIFLPSTESGSFADSPEFKQALTADFNLVLGDLSKNSITKNAVLNACLAAAKPTLLTRDTIDLISEDNLEPVLIRDNLIFFATMTQLQKMFRAVYYPKVLLLSQPLLQVVEALHKFTLSYPAQIITFHDGKIILAQNGNIITMPLENYSPLTMWTGELAAKIVALNLYNPNNFLKATAAAIFSNH